MHVRVVPPGHGLHARHVRSGGAAPRHHRRRGPHLLVLLRAHETDGRQFPARRRHGQPLRQHEVGTVGRRALSAIYRPICEAPLTCNLVIGLFCRVLQVAHSDPGRGNIRFNATERRLHSPVLLLPLVPARFQAGARLRRCVHRLGDDLGGPLRRLVSFRSLRRPGSGSVLSGNHTGQRHGLYRYHQILQR